MDDNGQLLSDAELVAQTLAGDREAFGQLYDRYARLIRAVALDASPETAAVQDFTQECFLRAFKQLPTLQAPSRFRAWVVGIARQLVRELRRRRPLELLAERVPAVAADPTAPSDDADEVEHVLRLVSQLPEHERLAVRLFYLSERNANETARLLKLSRSGTYALLKRACARLARWLEVPEREQEREAQP
jgi:RNA polymerase sigma factor (sigma-70 family)